MEWGKVVKRGALWVEMAVCIPHVNKMSQSRSASVTYYNSLYTHGVDEKRRVAIPAKWRTEGGEVEFTLILWPKSKEGPCLRVLPPEKMAEMLASIDAMPNSDPNKTVLKRFIGAKSEQVTCDRAGRICLPEEMAQAAGIKDEAILVGLLDRFEIWNPARYDGVKTSDEVMASEAFKLME